MKRAVAVLLWLFTVAFIASYGAVNAQAQVPDEPRGQTAEIVASIAAGGRSCGYAAYPLYCINVPTNVGGTMWIDVYYKAGTPSGFILFGKVSDLGMASITSSKITTNSLGQLTQIDLTINGSTDDGDGGTYTGTAAFTFSYVYSTGGGGRGNRGGYIMIMQSGVLNITYN